MEPRNFCVIAQYKMHETDVEGNTREWKDIPRFVLAFGLTFDEAKEFVKANRKPWAIFWIALAQEASEQTLS